MDVAARYFADYMLHQSKSSTFLIRKISQATNWLGQLYIYIHTCKYFHYLLLILILNNIFCRNMTIDVSAQYCLKVYLFEEKKKKSISISGFDFSRKNGWITCNLSLKLTSLFVIWETKAIPCKKSPRNKRSHSIVCNTPLKVQQKQLSMKISTSGCYCF